MFLSVCTNLLIHVYLPSLYVIGATQFSNLNFVWTECDIWLALPKTVKCDTIFFRCWTLHVLHGVGFCYRCRGVPCIYTVEWNKCDRVTSLELLLFFQFERKIITNNLVLVQYRLIIDSVNVNILSMAQGNNTEVPGNNSRSNISYQCLNYAKSFFSLKKVKLKNKEWLCFLPTLKFSLLKSLFFSPKSLVKKK